VAAHDKPVSTVLTSAGAGQSGALVLSVAESGVVMWQLSDDARGDTLERQGVMSVRAETGIDGDDFVRTPPNRCLLLF
jgi:hypothetical protein